MTLASRIRMATNNVPHILGVKARLMFSLFYWENSGRTPSTSKSPINMQKTDKPQKPYSY
jgi:hypothetical protein